MTQRTVCIWGLYTILIDEREGVKGTMGKQFKHLNKNQLSFFLERWMVP